MPTHVSEIALQFPIHTCLPDIKTVLSRQTRLVLEAPPGAGKTTQVPLALLDQGWLADKKILVLEPRRIAARSAAEFMAQQLNEDVGETVGYRIRFEAKISPRTRIEVVTEGILTRMIQSDPELSGIGAVVFDEFHERHLHSDLGLALALDIQAALRSDLRLVVMSATLDGERIAAWLDARRITSMGRSFPVRIEYPPAKAQEDWPFFLRRTLLQALSDNTGDVLVFLPGRREIDQAKNALSAIETIELVPLHGELSLAEQHAALRIDDDGKRRVVLATNVAESSVTLPGIRSVIDLGLAREPKFDPQSGFTRLVTVAISQASADQRAGRAGRVAPGTCYRLWPQSQRLERALKPEIEQVELASLALELAAWGSNTLRWLDPPPSGPLAQARDLLSLLDALDDQGHLTEVGRKILAIGTHPRLAAAALRAAKQQQALVCDALALLEGRNPLRGAASRSDDFRQRAQALNAFRIGNRRNSEADPAALAALNQAATGWRQRLGVSAAAANLEDALTLGNVLVYAYPDRIARQDKGNPRRYQLSNGRGARLHENTSLYGEPWLVVLDLRFEERDSLILTATPFDPAVLEWEFARHFIDDSVLRFNETTRSLDCFEQRRFANLILEQRPVQTFDSSRGLALLLNGVRELGLSALPWSEEAAQLRTRIMCAREWCPELNLPDVSDAFLLDTLEQWLAPYLVGKSRLSALSGDDVSKALSAQLDYSQRRQLDEQVPVAIRVPSGNERRLIYHIGQPPTLAVKLQELFGLADTPRIAKDRVAVVLHLLSPAQRPIQVTQDLRGFWERTYPEVKKELKGRYPRHPWPDDPWSAKPTARAKPRG